MNPKLILWGQNIVDVRKRLGLSQAAFAKELGTSQGVLSSWESGRHGPSLTFIRRIVSADPEHRAMSKLFPEDADIPG
jgi:DNA-binding transcriptional regulator YiaG